jgi:hypothetical protein
MSRRRYGHFAYRVYITDDDPVCVRARVLDQDYRHVWIEELPGAPYHGLSKWGKDALDPTTREAWERFEEEQKQRIRTARETILDAERLLKRHERLVIERIERNGGEYRQAYEPNDDTLESETLDERVQTPIRAE